MSLIPIPSTVHYEVPLQILEQQTLRAISGHPEQRQLAHEMVITLRKVMSLQRRLEESCEQSQIQLEHRWGLEEKTFDTSPAPNA
ncbi:MAG: DUF5340 domain-containing protein [Synechococcales cyanobacterium CRU_2_2]|nr:DUF5340 domain-containing protein [Synechococcales cyanobacterium CRU_2_2]